MRKRPYSQWVLAGFCFLTVACSLSESEPGASIEQWSVTAPRTGEYLFEASGEYTNPKKGVFHRRLETTDERGCRSLIYIEKDDERSKSPNALNFELSMPFTSNAKIARARFFIEFWDIEQSVYERGKIIFSEEKVVDASLDPPDYPERPCNSSKGALRKKAQRDPDGADADTISTMSHQEAIATAINTAGYLCARITDLYPQGRNMVATCVEYRNGKGRAKYRIDTENMTVTPI